MIYLPLFITLMINLPLFTTLVIYLPLFTTLIINLPLFITLVIYLPLFTTLMIYLPLFTTFVIYLPLFITLMINLPLFTTFVIYLPFLLLSAYYDSECLMDNPFYQEPTQECDLCQDTHDVEEIRTGHIMFPLVKRYSRQQRPFVFKVSFVCLFFFCLTNSIKKNNTKFNK